MRAIAPLAGPFQAAVMMAEPESITGSGATNARADAPAISAVECGATATD